MHTNGPGTPDVSGFTTYLFVSGAVAGAFVGLWALLGSPLMCVLSGAWCGVALAGTLAIRRYPRSARVVIGACMGAGTALIFVASLVTGMGSSGLTVFLVVMPAIAAYNEGFVQAVLWMLVCIAAVLGLHVIERVAPVPVLADATALDAFFDAGAVLLLGAIAVSARFSWDEAHHALARARDQAVDSADERLRFLWRMSHEIRTPLHGAIGMADVLIDSDLDPQQREAVRVIRQSADGLVEVVNRVLDLARLDADALELVEVRFELLDVLEDTLDLFAVIAWDRDIRISSHIDDDVPTTFVGDPIRVRQVLVNLVGNAVKHTHQGSVVVGVSRAGSDADGRIAFAVRDTGDGMDAETMRMLFEPFWQGDAGGPGGSGLGLALSRRLARRMGGDVKASSSAGLGSTFVFTVPLVDGGGRTTPVTRHAVLFDADPVPPTFVTAARSLGIGCVAPTASGPEPSLVVFAARHPRLSDVIQRAKVRYPGVPRVLLTSVADRDVRPRARELGLTDLLFEPARRDALRVLLEGPSLPSAPTPQPLGHARVLVVDDSPVNCQIASLMVERLGLVVASVDSGEAAIEQAATGAFDLVLMDVMMPGMSGIEAARAILTTMESPPVIVALSASNLEEQREECLAAGMAAHLDKPLSLDALARVLREHLPA
ncbi:MAG: response regulator [Myxococcota bacterium]